eukprot:260769-Karenia_brevis.AAC.1
MLDLNLVEGHVVFALEELPKIGSFVRVFDHADVHWGTGRKPAWSLHGAKNFFHRDVGCLGKLRCAAAGVCRGLTFGGTCQEIEATTGKNHDARD